MSLLVVGTVAFDSIETPFGSVERILGGSATYGALAAGLLADPVRLSAVVGGDFPQRHIESLTERGVDLQGLEVKPEEETFFWAGRYHYDLNQRDTLATHLNVLADFKPTLPTAYRDTRIVCLGNLDPSVQMQVLDQVERPEVVVLDTMNFWIEHAPESLREVLRRIDVLVVNDAEARELAEDPNLIRAAAAIREMGPKTLVIKKGEHGALLFTESAVFAAPAYPLEEVVDPTGAGDTFMGGFAGHLARQESVTAEALKQAVVVGSALASFVVEAFGPDRLMGLSSKALGARIEEFYALSAIPPGITLSR